MMRKELVRQPDGTYKEMYVNYGPSSAKPANHGYGVYRPRPIVIGRS